MITALPSAIPYAFWQWYNLPNEAKQIGSETAKEIMKKRMENSRGPTPKELQEREVIPPNEKPKEAGLTQDDLRGLGLLAKK